jgi:hypothetical protein
VTLEEWLKAMPDFRMADGAVVEWGGGQTRGPERVDFVVERAARSAEPIVAR